MSLNTSSSPPPSSSSSIVPPTWIQKINEIASDPQQIEKIRDSCVFATISHGVMGFGFGAFLGLFLSSFTFSSPELHLHTTDTKLSTGQQIKATFKEMGLKSWRSAKSFSLIAALFSSVECMIEGYRAKHDIYNTIAAGCSSGGILSIKCNNHRLYLYF